ncbi:MAG: hypothetical protein NWF01_04285 [Candidatus Bathyarchaeota archaeon]|nr:hypothetical protein [Candidatus Bathyarchaeota archaeon]
MESLKKLAQGFLAAAGLVWCLNIAAIIQGGDAWLGLLYALTLLIPAISLTYLKLKTPNTTTTPRSEKLRGLLFAFQGVALAFWCFDIVTTVYAIDITGLAIELNPLGWPLGILGAFAYYAPTMVFSYVLLYRMKEKITLAAAVPLTLLTLGMASMNLMAGAQNFQVFVDTAYLTTSVRYSMLAMIVMVNLALPLTVRRLVIQPEQVILKTN